MQLHRTRRRTTERDPWLDNAKMILVTLVVVGHAWTMCSAGTALWDHIYSFLYAWHMPAFVMISGYLSRGFVWNRVRIMSAVRTLLVPYVILECLLGLFRTYVGGEHLGAWVVHPHWPMWFLCALFAWRMLTPVFRAMPRPVAIGVAVTVSVLIGWSSWQIFDVARMLGFLPFFVVGLCASKRALELLRTRVAKVAAVATMGLTWWATGNIDVWARADWLYYNSTYAELDVHGWTAVPTRLAVLALGLASGLAFLALVPRRGAGWFTVMGSQTLIVYLFHGFFIESALYLGAAAPVQAHPLAAWFVMTGACVLVALALASPWVSGVLGWVADPVTRMKGRFEHTLDLASAADSELEIPDWVPDEMVEELALAPSGRG